MADAKALATQAAAAYLTGGASLMGGGIGDTSGGSTVAPGASSRSGDAALSYGSFGGVSIGAGPSSNNTLYIALAAVAGIALLALLMLRR